MGRGSPVYGTLNRYLPGAAFTVPLCTLLLLVGCGPKSPLPEGRIPPNPSAPASYGAAKGTPTSDIPRLLPPRFLPTNWQSAPFAIVETELSPALLVHSTNRYLGLFTGLPGSGLSAPSRVGWSTPGGPRSFANGESLDVMHMEENWVLVWFAGAAGWTNWDSPWAVFLQHRPASMKLDSDGLHFTFSNRAGDVVLLPLYGADKLPLKGQAASKGEADKQVKTWEWAAALPRDPLIRVRYWASASRRFPLHCEDSFSVNRAEDTVTIRSRMTWHEIEDDWKTKPLRLAPLSPTLALVVKDTGFPVRFSLPPFDLGMLTPWGPYYGVPDVDSFDATFSVLQYVNETLASPGVTGRTNRADSIAAKIQSAVRAGLKATEPDKLPGGVEETLVRDAWFAKALPILDAGLRTNAAAQLRLRWVNYLTKPSGPATNAVPPAGIFEALWAYAHQSEDWELVRSHWPVIRGWFAAGRSVRWAGFGRLNVVANGDLAAPCLAFARLAYQAGDLDSYGYGCSLLARDLVHLWARQRGAEYFRQHLTLPSPDILLTELREAPYGWRIEGRSTEEGQRYGRRWARFKDWDCGRFYQDYLGPQVRRELDSLRGIQSPNRSPDRLDVARSLPQLRALLLNETPDIPATDPDRPLNGPDEEIVAGGLCALQTSQPTRYERLIPGGPSTPFVTGPEREETGSSTHLVTSVYIGQAPGGSGPLTRWPTLIWPVGATSTVEEGWTFGQIRPVRSGPPGRVEVVPINWNTRLILVERPQIP